MFTYPTTFYQDAAGGGSWGASFGSWNYRATITVDNTKVPATATGFPVYVDLSHMDATFFANVKVGGADIRVTTSDANTEVPVQIVWINIGASTGEIHFEAPSLSSSSDTTFYIYFGNSGASMPATTATYGSEAVWANSYEYVLHGIAPTLTVPDNAPFKDAHGYLSAGIQDSTANAYDFNDGATVFSLSSDELADSDWVAAKVGYGIKFRGASSQYLFRQSANPTIAYPFTFSSWVYQEASVGEWVWAANPSTSPTTTYMALRKRADEAFDMYARNTTLYGITSAVKSTGTWYLMHCVFRSATDREFFIDGVSVGTDANSVTAFATVEFTRLAFGPTNLPFQGRMDEMRHLSRSIDVNWALTEYNNQNSPATFYTVGTSEAQ